MLIVPFSKKLAPRENTHIERQTRHPDRSCKSSRRGRVTGQPPRLRVPSLVVRRGREPCVVTPTACGKAPAVARRPGPPRSAPRPQRKLISRGRTPSDNGGYDRRFRL